jgi:hypothetical protein
LSEDRSAGAQPDRKPNEDERQSEAPPIALSIIVYCLKHWFVPEPEG